MLAVHILSVDRIQTLAPFELRIAPCRGSTGASETLGRSSLSRRTPGHITPSYHRILKYIQNIKPGSDLRLRATFMSPPEEQVVAHPRFLDCNTSRVLSLTSEGNRVAGIFHRYFACLFARQTGRRTAATRCT